MLFFLLFFIFFANGTNGLVYPRMDHDSVAEEPKLRCFFRRRISLSLCLVFSIDKVKKKLDNKLAKIRGKKCNQMGKE